MKDDIYTAACSVLKKLQDAGYTTYFAGGWVRDYLMDHPSDDIDIATTAPVDVIQSLFSKTIPVGISFGIIIVVEMEYHFEVATFRTERGYEDGRRPSHIEPASPEEDALRRDFTINGMYYDPTTDTLIDYVEGKKDIHARLVKAIGDPNERFREDRLRMIRAVRYAARFSFTIEPKTEEAIKAHAHLLFPSVAIERVWSELVKMAKFPHFEVALGMLHNIGLLQTIFPTLQDVSFESIHSRLSPLPHCPEDVPTILQIMHLFPTHTIEEKRGIGEMLKLSKADLKHIDAFHFFSHEVHKEDLTPYEKVQLLAMPWSTCYLKICAAQHLGSTQYTFLEKWNTERETLKAHIERKVAHTPIVTAKDLLACGATKGPLIGTLLEKAEMYAVNHNVTSKDAILTHLGLKKNG